MRLPWWAWVLLVVAVLFFFFVRASKVWRATIRAELADYLAEHAPELEVEVSGERELTIRQRGSGAAGTLYLNNLLTEAARLENEDTEGRELLYRTLLGTIREGASALELDAERDLARLRPRLLTALDIENFEAQIESPVPAVSFGVPGLFAVSVLDSENSVVHLRRDDLAKLGLTSDEALEIAKDNFRDTLPAEIVHRTLEQGATTVVKNMDTYDAARLLLVPDLLASDQRIVALVPDRDTLALAPVPADGDWTSLRRLAKNAAGEPLWTRPILVQSTGFTPVE